MRGVLIGGLIGLLIGVMFILFSSLYTSYAAKNEVMAALTAIFLWIIAGGITAIVLELAFSNKSPEDKK